MFIVSATKRYEVILQDDFSFLCNLEKIDNAEYVIDQNVYELYEKYFRNIAKERLILIDAIEENKTIETALEICEHITEIPAKRNITLISIGGGIIQDISGFAANIIYRGIKWVFVPTTLLAACDSCIGGKTSLNYRKYKNLLGTFYAPDMIHICPSFFKTLSERDYKSGLGEVVKFNIMSGKSGLESIENNIDKLLERDDSVIKAFVESSLCFKKTFIEEDEFDKGERIKLNFAHTFGHAIEVISNYKIPHGTAVAIGMIMADSISYGRGYIDAEMRNTSEELLMRIIDIDVTLLDGQEQGYISAIRKDKKQVGNSLTAVLITEYGNDSTLTIVHDVDEEEVYGALAYFKKLYGTKKCL